MSVNIDMNDDPNSPESIFSKKVGLRYNKLFLNFLISMSNYYVIDSDIDWVILGLLAHELGHFNFKHFDSKKSQLQEHQADEYSGYIMNKLNASKEQAVLFIEWGYNLKGYSIIEPIFTKTNNTLYETPSNRKEAIQNGMNKKY